MSQTPITAAPAAASATTPWLDPRRLQALGSTFLRARGVVEGFLAGSHRSPHRGASVEFAEYKEYAPGDDVRHIDWRAWGRTDRYLLKQFDDETNVRTWLVLDTSGSMGFASGEGDARLPTKLLWGSVFVASLAWILLRQQDAAGLLTFEAKPDRVLPPSTRPGHLQDLCRVLDTLQPTGGTRVEAALSRITETVRARSQVVLVSDLLDHAEDALTLARVLRRRGMEVVVIHLTDPVEWTLDYEGLTLFTGLEGEGDLLVDPDDIRDAYVQAFAAHAQSMQDRCRGGDLEYYQVRTDSPVEGLLRQLLEDRSRRGRR